VNAGHKMVKVEYRLVIVYNNLIYQPFGYFKILCIFEVMARPKMDRKELLQNSLSVFKTKGFHATSISDLAQANGLLKGSLYHYIESKEALMEEILLALKSYYTEKVFTLAYKDSLTLEERIDRLAEEATTVFTEEEGGDFIVNIGIETLNTHPQFNRIIQEFFKEWFRAMSYLFIELGYPKKQAQIKAQIIVAEIEGSVMLTRLLKDKQFLHRTFDNLKLEFRDITHAK
jgi:TetR/AcrR family transcriptional repressor of nem operon